VLYSEAKTNNVGRSRISWWTAETSDFTESYTAFEAIARFTKSRLVVDSKAAINILQQ